MGNESNEPIPLSEIVNDPQSVIGVTPDIARLKDATSANLADEIDGLREKRANIIQAIQDGTADATATVQLSQVEAALQSAHADEFDSRNNPSGNQT